jgi:DNA-binding NarL/FixJ family response regulator
MSEAIRIAVIDDHPIFLEGVDRVLSSVQEVELVATGTSAADACRIAAELKPDLMLMDISMPGGGIEAVRAIATSHPSVKVIMLTASSDNEHIAAAIEGGAHGYLVKGMLTTELLHAIKVVQAGEPYITPDVSARFIVQKFRQKSPVSEAVRPQVKLNNRDQEILDLVMEGMTNQQIAKHLNLAQTTVRNRLSHIFEKLQVHSRTQAMAVWRRK